MPRVNFLYVDIKVYPASIEEGRHTGYNMDSILIADQPVLTTFENVGLIEGCRPQLKSAIIDWITNKETQKGRELLYKDCPKAPAK